MHASSTRAGRAVSAALSWLLAAYLLAPRIAWAQSCPGDCDRDGRVAPTELVRVVRIALRQAAGSSCEQAASTGGERVGLEDIVSAVRARLEGCNPGDVTGTPQTPTNTPSPTVTVTPTASPTRTRTPFPGTECGNGVAENGEECDDGGQANGDGCSARCELEEDGDVCTGVPTRSGASLDAVLITNQVRAPLYVTAPPRDPSRIFIVSQGGEIRVVEWGQLRPTPFLDLSDKVTAGGERGLLSLAFHPDYERNGELFVDYTTTVDGQLLSVVSRFRVSTDPNLADRSSEEVVLRQDQPFVVHKGGHLLFGPDGYLYVPFGDGGISASQQNNGQDPATWLGKILRIDVDGGHPYEVPPDNPFVGPDGVLDEIWVSGLRNPWRIAIDPPTGVLYIGDVGEQRREEIDIEPTGRGGANYGWCCMEGNLPLSSCFQREDTCPIRGLTRPALNYPHVIEDPEEPAGCSVTGGFVYRGCAMPDLHGTYFYGDYCAGFVRSFVYDGGQVSAHRNWTEDLAPGGGRDIRTISSFGTDARGELYICDFSGNEVFRIVPQAE